jgi:hypothetical protein
MGTATAVGNKLDILNAVPNKAAEKSSSKVPVVAITAALESKLKEIAELKEAMKDAEGHKTLLEAEIMPQVEKLRRDLSIREKKHLPSISLAGIANWTCQNKYSMIDLLETERLQQMFNGKFSEYIKTETKLDVDVEKISVEALTLLMRDGAVTRKSFLKPTEIFHAARSTDANVAALADSFGLRPVSFLKF